MDYSELENVYGNDLFELALLYGSGNYWQGIAWLESQTAVAPSVFAFSCPGVAGSTIAITAFTAEATAPSALAKYWVGETAVEPAVDDPGWSSTKQTSWTSANDGAITLYARVLDNNGKISAAKSATVVVLPGLMSWQESDLGNPSASSWPDQSGSGNGLSQATEGLRPLYVTSGGVNDLPYFRYGADDTADHLDWAAGTWTGLQAVELLIVFVADADPPATASETGLYNMNATASFGSLVPFQSGSTIYAGLFNTTRPALASSSGATASICVWNERTVSTPAALTSGYLNGVQISDDKAVTYSVPTGVTYVGATGDRHFKGNMYALAVCAQIQSSGARKALLDRWSVKYGTVSP